MLDRRDGGHPVLRSYYRTSFVKQYEKAETLLRTETCVNDPRHRLAEANYRLSRLRYDLGKLRAHGFAERIGRTTSVSTRQSSIQARCPVSAHSALMLDTGYDTSCAITPRLPETGSQICPKTWGRRSAGRSAAG